jgi:hypothetical protein
MLACLTNGDDCVYAETEFGDLANINSGRRSWSNEGRSRRVGISESDVIVVLVIAGCCLVPLEEERSKRLASNYGVFSEL